MKRGLVGNRDAREQLPLFPDTGAAAPMTEGIKYAGSKYKLLPQILRCIQRVNAKTVLDGFSGTTRVSQALAQSGYRVICNDRAVWSQVFGTCYLLNRKQPEEYIALIAHLNAVPPIDGWFTEHYGGLPNGGCAVQKDGLKKPWQIHNTRKLDAIRAEIDRLALEPVDKAVALTSLMLALDQVDNSLGHYVSYLKNWSKRSYGTLELQVPRLLVNKNDHTVFREDIFDIVPRVEADLAYFDPPYGSNNEKMPPSRVRYASYYHIWTTICLNDTPELFGKALRRQDTSDTVSASVFEEFRRNGNNRYVALEAIEKLIADTKARWILLSYSSGGRATATELNEILRANGRLIEIVEMDYKKNVMAGMKWTNKWVRDAGEPNREFLFLLEKNRPGSRF